ncbi:MAG: hypothetical protein HXX11_05450 [Desulfuromonadales bacterium]|nr:hypothetical protein [Desulfuromonadales bacterium]
MATPHSQEIACQQVLVEDASVFSLQWSIFPISIADSLTPDILRNRYLDYIRSCTATLIRPTFFEEGVEFRLLSSSISLISFLPPDNRQDKNVSILRICGGILVQPRQCDRGELRFGVEQVDAGVKVSLLLCDFCPLILGGPSPSPVRFWLYRLTQAFIHRLVTIRFLTMLYRNLAGSSAPVRLVKIRVRDGQPV